MGVVYLAQDTNLDRKVAIKFLLEDMEDDAPTRARFVREAKSAAALDHPFICKIYETGEANGKPYIAMEYVEGKNLKDKTEEESLPLRDSLRIGLEIAEALEKAHKSGIVHRDLKPANIMLTPQGHVKVMDFGLAKRILPSGEEELSQTITQASITEKGTIAGTLAYMSPEQAKGDQIDGRSDIFALGIILYEMISGKHPFSKTSVIETLSAILRDPHPPTNVKPKAVNPVISPILRKALAKDTKERYQNVADFAVDLRNAQKDILGGSRLLYRGLPILAASVVIIALLVVAIFKFTRPGAVATPDEGHEPISFLVADFQNQTDEPVFNGSLEYAMSIGLEGAPFITTYQRPRARRVVNQLNPDAEGKLDAEMARLVCIREGINLFMDGEIGPKDDGYILKVWARDPTNPENVSEYSKTMSSKGEVLTAAAWLANKVISDLGGTPAESAQVLAGETFTTSSLEAMNAYNNAQELQVIGKQEEAIKEYLRAINLDSDFGRAYSGLAMVYHNRGQFEEREKYFNQAMAKIDKMSEREKFRIMAVYYLYHRNFQKAIAELTELLEKYPADYSGRLNLALAYFYARNYTQAKEMGRQAVEIYPYNSMSRFNLSWYALADGDIDMAEQEAQTAIDNSPGYEKPYVVLALTKFMRGESAEAVEIYNKLKTISQVGESLAVLSMADMALYEGRLSDASEILENRIASDIKEDRTHYLGYKWALLANTHLLSGKKTRALEAADSAVAAGSDLGTMFIASQIYIQAGRKDNAHLIAAELSNELGSEPQAYAKIIEGEILKKNGRIQEAIGLFNQAQETLDMWIGRFSLGKALLDIEAYLDAHNELNVCLDRQGETASVFFNDVPSLHYLPLIYYYLGRTQEGIGSDAAAESYQIFLRIKANSDEGDPLVEDCLRRLAGR